MPATQFQLSRLAPLAEYLAQGTDLDAGLADVLEEALPRKSADKLVKLLDNLLQQPRGAQVLLLTMTFLLDEWLREGHDVLQQTNQEVEPFVWLATADHLEVVQAFRDLL